MKKRETDGERKSEREKARDRDIEEAKKRGLFQMGSGSAISR